MTSIMLMDSGRWGPRELTGAIDLVTYYGLHEYYEYFCKKPLPVSVADSQYLHRVVGETGLRKGEGMELGQLSTVPGAPSQENVQIGPLDLEVLQWGFTLLENAPVELLEADKGLPTISGDVKNDKDKKHKKKHKNKKRKHRHKDKDKDKEKDKDKDKVKDKDKDKERGENGEDRKKRKKKKRKHEGEEEGDSHKHRKKKHKHKEAEVAGVVKNGK